MDYKFGYIPDEIDERDYKYNTIEQEVSLPSSVDLRSLCSPVRDQQNLGSCTGFAIAVGMREFLTNKEGKYSTRFSPLYLYYKERELEGTINEDAGAYTRDGFKVLKNNGCCRESYWPYIVSKFKTKPPLLADLNALFRYKIKSYYRMLTLQSLKNCLAQGYGAVLGFMVYDSFMTIDSTGLMPLPKSGEKILGGHAVFCAGYDDTKKHLIIKNSWGTGWGDKGYFYMNYAFVTPKNIPDMWTAR